MVSVAHPRRPRVPRVLREQPFSAPAPSPLEFFTIFFTILFLKYTVLLEPFFLSTPARRTWGRRILGAGGLGPGFRYPGVHGGCGFLARARSDCTFRLFRAERGQAWSRVATSGSKTCALWSIQGPKDPLQERRRVVDPLKEGSLGSAEVAAGQSVRRPQGPACGVHVETNRSIAMEMKLRNEY